MAKLIDDDPQAAPDDMVLEVNRVEDARTLRQRLRIPAARWREFLRAETPDAAPGGVEQAYLARREFWDWLAEEHADSPPGTPMDEPHERPAAPPSAAWLSERYRDWRDHRT